MYRTKTLRGTSSALVLALLLALSPGAFGLSCISAATSPAYSLPVKGEILRVFEAPAHRYAPGHRGIDIAAPVASAVGAAGAGQISFAGQVGGEGLFITIAHPEGIWTSYSYLSQISVVQGQRVYAGQTIGNTGAGHPEGPPAPHVHFGAFVKDQAGEKVYMDPLALIGADLNDISKLIRLAPMDRGEGWWQPANESTSTNDAMPSARPWDELGFFPWLGSKIEGAGKSAVDTTLGAVSQGRSFAKWMASAGAQVVRGAKSATGWAAGAVLKSARASAGIADWVKSSYGTARKAVSAIYSGWKKTVAKSLELLRAGARGAWRVLRATASFLRTSAVTVRRVVSRTSAHALSWIRTQMQAVVSSARNLANVGLAGGVGVRDALRAIKPVIAMLPITISKGLFDEVRCRMKGGSPLPQLASREEILREDFQPEPQIKDSLKDRVVVAVAGIGTQTEKPGGQPALYHPNYFRALGYPKGQIFNFSYAGSNEDGTAKPYGKEATYQSLSDSALQLSDLLQQAHRRYPGKEIDIVAHSQGGLVGSYFLSFLHKPRTRVPRIGHFASLNSPHQGAILATLGSRVSDSSEGRSFQGRVAGYTGTAGRRRDFIMDAFEREARRGQLPDPTGLSISQMRANSQFMEELRQNSHFGRTKATSISAWLDYIVPANMSGLPGANNYSIQINSTNAHNDIIWNDRAKGILYNTVRDQAPPCTGLSNALGITILGPMIGAGQNGLLSYLDVRTGFHWSDLFGDKP